jgi:hypothetical protein
MLTLVHRSDASSKPFPTPYHFVSNDDAEALARRAARFQKPSAGSSTSGSGAGGLSMWFGGDEDSGIPGLGMVPGQVGRKKMKGKLGLGYGSVEVQEVDPVSAAGHPATRGAGLPLIRARTSSIGIITPSEEQAPSWKSHTYD